jgi:uncharacterized membrane-anchored protein YjiN (DUF445 family)
MRRIATGVLLALAVVFLLTYLVRAPGPPALLLRAMAEAGMVGGLADWFAVEALFRHPLGLPIPHTALLPNNQTRAAQNVGRFFDTYFLDPDQLRRRLAETNLALRLVEWLSDAENARFLTVQITAILASLFHDGIGKGLAPNGGKFLRQVFLSAMDGRDLSSKVALLLRESLHGPILDEVLERVRSEIDGHRDRVVKIVEDRSRWWIASAVDTRIAGLLVDGVVSLIEEMSAPGAPLRVEFEMAIGTMIDGFERDGLLTAEIERSKVAFVESDAFAQLTHTLATAIRSQIGKTLEDEPDEFALLLATPLAGFAQTVLHDPALRADFEARLVDGLVHMLTRIRPEISAYVTDTISSWDSSILIERFETQVGRDLQFIRINGAVLGALIGGLLYFFGLLLS